MCCHCAAPARCVTEQRYEETSADKRPGLSINCLLLLVFTHALFPRMRPTTSQFFSFQYHDPSTGLYKAGWDDLKLVALWVVIFTMLRAATMDYVLLPCAKYIGINKKKATIRFSEQAWMLIYYCIFWSLGLVGIPYSNNDTLGRANRRIVFMVGFVLFLEPTCDVVGPHASHVRSP